MDPTQYLTPEEANLASLAKFDNIYPHHASMDKDWLASGGTTEEANESFVGLVYDYSHMRDTEPFEVWIRDPSDGIWMHMDSKSTFEEAQAEVEDYGSNGLRD